MAETEHEMEARKPTTSMDSTFPCELPEDSSLLFSSAEFEKHVTKTFADLKAKKQVADQEARMADLSMDHIDGKNFMDALKTGSPTPKMSGLEKALAPQNKMLTENGDVTYKSTNSALLDLFVELEKAVDDSRLETILQASWKEDPLATLKIIWNARSIHLGKGEQETFYKCLGWMKGDHPVTVISNLQWLYRSVIEKKVKKNDDDDDAMTLVEKEDAEDNSDGYDVLHGVSHGYWKDLLNILVLAANHDLEASGNPRDILHKKNEQPKSLKKRTWNERHGSALGDGTSAERFAKYTKQNAKTKKHEIERRRHEQVLKRLEDPFYRCLHLAVARLFAQQLQTDKGLLESEDLIKKSKISLAAKWAPSLEGFHDKQTLIATSIAEILFPRDRFPTDDSRELYLKRAREAYRGKYLSPLRHALDVVERKVTQEAFSKINYAKVPSLAMDAYKDLFVKKDFEHYEKYIDKVAAGKSRISGAVLTPGSLVHQAREAKVAAPFTRRKDTAKALIDEKIAGVLGKTLDGQWATLVKRIKDNGSLSSSIAVCDVSGSMQSPIFPDKTCPLDHSVGLSLLIAEVTEKPFGGCFISFSSDPKVHNVGGPDDTASLRDKVQKLDSSHWTMNTDFVAVFERLLLPIAQKNNIKSEDMVKQVIVFSDMQFDQAQTNAYQGYKKVNTWQSSFDRVKRQYESAGYELPRLVFWNLAGGRGGYGSYGGNVAPKPVTKEEENCLMVSGYSQGMLKMFLDNGTFEAEEEEEIEEVTKEDDGTLSVKTVKKKPDPMSGVWKAIGHKAYDMLKVID